MCLVEQSTTTVLTTILLAIIMLITFSHSSSLYMNTLHDFMGKLACASTAGVDCSVQCTYWIGPSDLEAKTVKRSLVEVSKGNNERGKLRRRRERRVRKNLMRVLSALTSSDCKSVLISPQHCYGVVSERKCRSRSHSSNNDIRRT